MVSGRAVITLILALVMLASVQAIVPLMAAQAAPSPAAQVADGGVIKPSTAFTLETGANGYILASAGVLTYTAEYTGLGTPIVLTYTDDLSQVIEYTVTQQVLTVPAQVSFYSAAADDPTATYRVSVAIAGESDAAKQIVLNDLQLALNTAAVHKLGLTLGDGDVVRVRARDAQCAFNLFGTEIT